MGVSVAAIAAFYVAFVGGVVYVLRSGTLWGYEVATPYAVGAGVGGVALFVLGQWLVSTRYVLRRAGSETVERDDHPWLVDQAETMADEMGIDTPTIALANLGEPNAFAIGRQNSGTVVLSRRLVARLAPREIRAVMAHEFAHLKNRDSVVMLLGQTIATLIGAVLSGLFWADAMRRDGNLIIAMLGALASTLVHMLVMAFVLSISRYREYVADDDAATYTDPDDVAAALGSIRDAHRGGEAADHEFSALFIFGRERGLLSRVLADHPPIDRRIERLRERAD